MFLNERCPLVLKVRTKIAELLVLRKMEAIEIYSIYPNIWKRINKKSLFNMEQIKLKIKKELFFVSRKYGSTKERKILKNSKSLQKYLKINVKTKNIHIKAKKNKKNKSAKNKQKEKLKEKSKISNNENNNNSINDTKENDSQKKNSNKEYIHNKEAFNDKDEEANQKSLQKYPITKIIDNYNDANQENKNSEKIISDKENSNKLENEKDDKKEKHDQKLSKNNNESMDYNALIYNNNQKNNYDKIENKCKVIKDGFRNRLSYINFHIKKQSINNSIISNNPSINTKKFKISCFNEEEKIFNSFTNLTTTNEQSFQLNSSYENLNEITKNQYINDSILQSKTKQFLYNECFVKNTNFLAKNNLLLTKDPLNGQIIISKKTIGRAKDFSLEEDKRSINSFDLSKLKSDRSHKNSNGSKDSTLEKNKKDKNIERLKTKRHNSFKSNGMIIKTNMNESPNLNKIKSPKKRREIGVNHQLDIISKNITGASKNINNPEQFYMDFFNDLINKKACLINKTDKLNNKDINEQEKHKNKKKV